MQTLKDDNNLKEIQCGSNFAYILEDDIEFANTEYKVLQNEMNGIFVQCMKMLYNGKMEVYYVTDDYISFSSMFSGIKPNVFITVITNLISNVIEVQNNGFLTCQSIDLSWDKIFVDEPTLKVKLVYLPINSKTFENDSAFESELRSGIIKLIDEVIETPTDRINQLVSDLRNGSMSLEDICGKSKGGGKKAGVVHGHGYKVKASSPGDNIRMVAMNAPQHFEIVVDRDVLVIGKKAELVDAVIPFNKMISRKHCRITKQGGSYYITDEGSANGTYINSKCIVTNKAYQVNRGDIIRLADSDFQIV